MIAHAVITAAAITLAAAPIVAGLLVMVIAIADDLEKEAKA